MKNPFLWTEKQWKAKYKQYLQICRRKPWKIDEEHIASFEEFRRNTLDIDINTDLIKYSPLAE